jgi:hypothetical protein
MNPAQLLRSITRRNYGTTLEGGTNNNGVVWEVTP